MKPAFDKLITKEEALAAVFARWTPEPEMETVPVAACAGRVLARDVTAKYDIPVVRASAMDGVAVKSAAFAGGMPDMRTWRLGRDYVRADTGDDFDDAFDAVVMIEVVEFLPEGGLAFRETVNVTPGLNVKPRGAELRQGTVIARAGTLLTVTDMAAVGMSGEAEVAVIKKPRVGFIPTGSELTGVGSTLGRGQYFDVNSPMAAALLREMGAEPVLHPLVRDEPAALRGAMEEMLAQCDLLLINAGTSKGGEDFCTRLLREQGELLFHGVAAVPGRPMSMAFVRGKPVVNLSGPSFAACYSVDWAVRALVCRWLGRPLPQRKRLRARLSAPFQCPPPFSAMSAFRLNRREDGVWEAAPLIGRGPKGAGSAALLTADAVYISAPGEKPRAAGEEIELELLRERWIND